MEAKQHHDALSGLDVADPRLILPVDFKIAFIIRQRPVTGDVGPGNRVADLADGTKLKHNSTISFAESDR